MKAIETSATVTVDGKLTVQLPFDIPPSEHQVVLVINEKPVIKEKRAPLNFPVHNCGSWPADLSWRREDMYNLVCPYALAPQRLQYCPSLRLVAKPDTQSGGRQTVGMLIFAVAFNCWSFRKR